MYYIFVFHIILPIVNIIYSNLYLLQVCICGFTIATGGASRIISGYDSYGNTCGQDNTKIEGVELSGRNMIENKLVWCDTNALTGIFTPDPSISVTMEWDTLFEWCIQIPAVIRDFFCPLWLRTGGAEEAV